MNANHLFDEPAGRPALPEPSGRGPWVICWKDPEGYVYDISERSDWQDAMGWAFDTLFSSANSAEIRSRSTGETFQAWFAGAERMAFRLARTAANPQAELGL